MVSNVEAIEAGGPLTQYNMIGKKRPAPGISGSHHLFDHWVLADIQLDDGNAIKGQYLNLDLQDGEIKVPYGDDIRVLHREKIKSFTSAGRTFVNADYLGCPAYKGAFFEVMEVGNIGVYCRYYSDVRPPTYVPGLAVGDRDYKVIIKKSFLVKAHTSLEAFAHDKKGNRSYFNDSPQTVAYIRQEKLRLNRIDDFIQAVRYYNRVAKVRVK